MVAFLSSGPCSRTPAPGSRSSTPACKPFGGIFDLAAIEARLDELNKLTTDPALWDNTERAQGLLQEQTRVSETLDRFAAFTGRLEEIGVLLELASEAEDEETAGEAAADVEGLGTDLRALELERMLSGPNDHGACYLQVNAGAGGTESMDWARMLLRMYLRYCERRGYKVNIVDQNHGEEAGIKSALLEVDGHAAYGYLKAESGVHRLVRISPYDASARRHTSFASVFVYPQTDDEIQIEVADADLRVDTYRASGAGGQHVNKTDSAVRLTHLPSGIVVQCQNERSQHKNRSTAMKILKARLVELERQKQAEEWEAMQAGKMAINFGSQIRSYVLQPYRMVKDLRTDVEIGNVDSVLDGGLDALIEAFLMKQASDQEETLP
jgi:peptide chain release factor 2